MIARYRISDRMFADMTQGPSSSETIALLRSSQLAKHKLLLRHLADAINDEWPEFRAALAVIDDVQRRDDKVVADLLIGPFVGAWAAWCTRRVRGSVRSPLPLRADLGYLAGLAVSAAMRSDIDADIKVPVRDGHLVLPTVGILRLESDAPNPVPAEARGGRLEVAGAALPQSGWHPARHVHATAGGMTLTVALEDLDPYRDCYRKPLAARMSAEDFDCWSGRFQEAWSLLVRYVPERARELTEGLQAMVPLSAEQTKPGLSATSRTAFGALALTLPDRPEHLAATMVHEFQHSKLSAFLDLLPLYDPQAKDKYFAPWRPDPRPIGGLLQGAYAFSAVGDVWHHLRDHAGDSIDATRRFAELREQVQQVIETLVGSPHLNEDGRQFVAQLRDAHAGQMTVRLPKTVVSSSHAALSETYAAWRSRNSR